MRRRKNWLTVGRARVGKVNVRLNVPLLLQCVDVDELPGGSALYKELADVFIEALETPDYEAILWAAKNFLKSKPLGSTVEGED